MDNKDITLVKDITQDKYDITVKVRVLHLWDQFYNNPQTKLKELTSIEMILIDEEVFNYLNHQCSFCFHVF